MHGLEQILWLHAVKGTETQECLLIWLAMAEALLSSLWSPPSIASKTCSLTCILNSPQAASHWGSAFGKLWQKLANCNASTVLNRTSEGPKSKQMLQELYKAPVFQGQLNSHFALFQFMVSLSRMYPAPAALMSYIRILLGEDLFDVCNRNLRSSQIFARVGNKLVWKIKVGTIVPLLTCAQGHQSLYVVKSQAQSTSRLSRSE